MATILPLGNDTARRGDVMGFAIGNGHERRQQTLVIQPNIKLDGALGGC